MGGYLCNRGDAMKHIWKKFIAFAFSMAFTALAAFAPVTTSFAATPTGDNTAWIRAKLTWEHDEGITGLDDSIIEFSNDGWTRTGDWFYYNMPVKPGDKVRLINGVKIPHEWDNTTADKKFRLIVTVEASEVAPGETGWDENTNAAFSEDFTVWSQGYKTDEDVWVKEGKLLVRINEYQLGEDGKLETYVNDKVVVPGQFVSKIVEIEVDGEKGANVKLVPEDPVKRVYVGSTEVDGKVVDSGTALTFEITVKNPSPDKKTITIYDTVDSRLTVTDTGGATMEGSKLTWKVDVEGKGEATVRFGAIFSDNVSEEKGEAIPNTAEADIVGKHLKSNTVVVGLGPVSALKMAVTRATGDYGVFGLAAFGAAVILASAIVIMAIRRRRNRSEV